MRLRLLALAPIVAGCGGGAPLLHPAKTLASGDVRASGGLSANVIPGAFANDLARARAVAAADTTAGGTPESNADFAKGALVAASVAPGIAPFAGARVGIGARYEAGLTYTGRAIRVDVRRAFGSGPWTFSVGAAGSAALYGRQQGTDLPNVAIGAMRGYGFDVPLLAGWESAGGIYKAWFGARGGFERVTIETLTSEPKALPPESQPLGLEANRFFGGGVAGVATGFHHVHVALEAGVSYQVVNGTYASTRATVRGITIAPATALWWTF